MENTVSLTIEQALFRANKLVQTGDIAGASKIYELVLAKYPGNTRVRRAYQALKLRRTAVVQPSAIKSPAAQDDLAAINALYNSGNLQDTLDRGDKLLARLPTLQLLTILGAAASQSGAVERAIEYFEAGARLEPDNLAAINNLGVTYAALGRHTDACAAYAEVARLVPNNADALYSYGTALQNMGDTAAAMVQYDNAIAANPAHGPARNNKGVLLLELGDIAAAADNFEHASAIAPDDAKIYANWGNALKLLGRTTDAIAAYQAAIARQSDFAEAHYNLGILLRDTGQREAAVESYQWAIALRPNHADAHYNLAFAYHDLQHDDNAISSYQRAIAIDPDHADAHNNMGLIYLNQNRMDLAITCFEKAIIANPQYASAHNNLGSALREAGRAIEALAAHRQAIAIKPDHAEAHYCLGLALVHLEQRPEAIAAFDQAVLLQPSHSAAEAQKLMQQAYICDWKENRNLDDKLSQLGITGDPVPPFVPLSFEDEPERHRIRAERLVQRLFPNAERRVFDRIPLVNRRLRIGYFSADFHTHPMMSLLARVFELHDRSAIELFSYSLNGPTEDPMRKRIVKASDFWRDVHLTSPSDIASLAHTDRLDVAIDLSGYTRGARLAIWANGVAPIQVNYLGYPGTMGAPFIDYIIADSKLIPNNRRKHYTENIIYLPDTYQSTDNTRVIASGDLDRTANNLPEHGFVFCCFNSSYKIKPAEYDVWMRLLHKVPGSVLWLLYAGDDAVRNLRREASDRGIEGHRIIFAQNLPPAEHLARHQLADLFLDNFIYNAHTTCSDALWAGLPVVTLMGQSFASRVAASLLSAIGLDELITNDIGAYERLALALATDPTRLEAIRLKLANNRNTTALFDTASFTRHLEHGYRIAYSRFVDGLAPTTIEVPNCPIEPSGCVRALIRVAETSIDQN